MIKGRNQENEILKEIAILAKARTKYVVRFLGYSVCNEGTLMAMEYMQAGNLYDALRRGDEFQWYNRYTILRQALLKLATHISRDLLVPCWASSTISMPRMHCWNTLQSAWR